MEFSVSMCVCGKDDPAWFTNAVDSILHQTVIPSEIVLVVDGPVSGELDSAISQCERNSLFRVIRFAENRGHGSARRAGLAACTNELVAIMDADDISFERRFEIQLDALRKNPHADAVGGQISEFIGDTQNCVGKRIVPTDDSAIKKYMKKRCPMNLVTVMFKRSSVEKVGGFIDWYCEEDYYLWVRMALSGMIFANVDEVLVNVRVGADMYRRRGGWKYFRSEAKLQKYMLKNRIIGFLRFHVNVAERLIVQVVLPANIRGWVFQKLARSKGRK